jgi:hypothetical protein
MSEGKGPTTDPAGALDVSGQAGQPPGGPDDDEEPKKSLDDPQSLVGASRGEVEGLIPGDFMRSPTRSARQAGQRFEYGWRYADPKRPGDQIRIMDGNPNAPDPFHRGPRVYISRGGVKHAIPLRGNPTL